MATNRRDPRESVRNASPKSNASSNNSSSSTPSVIQHDLNNIQADSYRTSLPLTGLQEVSINAIAGSLPKVAPLNISDPLNPPTDALRQTDIARENTKTIYKEIVNAYETVGDSFKAKKAEFDASKEGYKALGAGVQMATEAEKVRGNVIDYHTTVEANKQKFVSYVTSEYKTGIAVQQAAYTKVDLDAKLIEARNNSEMASAKMQKSKMLLDNFRKQLGEVK